eukprot:m.96159 g.96159  ORF g.96159 m.96159 type:complete len:329 (-) comp13063_c0_seq1:271-1257(-)
MSLVFRLSSRVRTNALASVRMLSAARPVSDATSVGFIGLGQMGARMAHNIDKAGMKVTVFDLYEPAANALVEKGSNTRKASSPGEVAAASSFIVTMLPDDDVVEETYRDDNGIFKNMQSEAVLIDSSTISPNVAQALAVEAKEKGATFMDAPVSGGVGGAEAGTLTFMVGAAEADFAKATPLLETMGKNIVCCGKSGGGQIAKLCNNLLLAISMMGTSEAMNMGVKLGMDPKILASILNSSTGRCWSSDSYNPCPGVMEGVPSSRGYTGGFAVELMLKDLRLAIEAAKSVEALVPLGRMSQNYYIQVAKEAEGKDFSYIYQSLKIGGR